MAGRPHHPAPVAPLVVQLTAWAALFLAGRLGALPAAATPAGALRLALAVMFAFTALSHFLPRTRPALVRMVPPALPAPGLLVTLTGLAELAGAAGRRWRIEEGFLRAKDDLSLHDAAGLASGCSV